MAEIFDFWFGGETCFAVSVGNLVLPENLDLAGNFDFTVLTGNLDKRVLAGNFDFMIFAGNFDFMFLAELNLTF